MSRSPEARNWIDLLQCTAADRPEQIAFGFLADGERLAGQLSYRQLDRQARAIAAFMRERGLAGQRVLLLYPPGLGYVAAFFGCLYAGAVAVPVYPPSRRPNSLQRLLGVIADCGASTAMTTAGVAARADGLAAAAGLDLLATDTITENHADSWTDPGATSRTLAFIQYTSGSTGQPRGVVVSHGNLLSNAATTQRLFGTSDATRVVSWLPIYHDMGLIGSVLGTVHCGGTCTLMSPTAFIQRPARWLEAISASRATASGAPDFAYEMCAQKVTEEERSGLDLSSWEVAFNGAEPIRASTLRRFAETFAECGFRPEALTPCYGLAEATLLVTTKTRGTTAISSEVPGGGAPLVSCGPVPAEHQVRIIDPGPGTSRGDGEVGEIWVSAPSVADGYLGRDAETAERFRATLADEPGRFFLRTGDLGCVHGGELYVTGRIKDLIVIRGRNHYPQDIEQTAEAVDPALRRGGGAAFSVRAEGAEQLAVVHELDRGYQGDAIRLATSIGAAVASAHGVRPHTVVLIKSGSLPRTSSGKVRRTACREQLLAGELAELARSDAAPDPDLVPDPDTGPVPGARAMPAEQDSAQNALNVLRAEIASLLGEQVISVDQPLIALGLDSLATFELQQRIQRRFGQQLDFDEVADRTATELAARLSAGTAPTAVAAPPVSGPDLPDCLPLSDNQRSQWLSHQLTPASRRHIIAAAVEVDGDLDTRVLEQALAAVIRQQPALRSTFEVVGGKPVQRFKAMADPAFCLHEDLGLAPEALRTAMEHDAYRPFDVENGPLVRLSVFPVGAGSYRLVVALHHLVADLWSLELLVAALDQQYLALSAAEPTPSLTAARYPARADRDPDGRMLAYWRAELADAPGFLSLPRDGAHRTGGSADGDAVRLSLGPELTAKLNALAREQHTTTYSVLMAAWQLLLGQLTGTRDVVVAAPVHGRDNPADAATIGFLADIVPVRARFTDGESFRGTLHRSHQTLRGALGHAGVSFPALVEKLNPPREPGRPPLAQAVLTLHRPIGPLGELVSACALGMPGATGRVGGLVLRSVEFTPPPSQFDVGLSLAQVDGSLTGLLHFAPGLIGRPAAERWAAAFTGLLTAVAADPDAPVPLAQPDLVQTDLVQPTRTTIPAAPETAGTARPVHELFAARAAATPDRTAVIAGDIRLTYRELDERSNRLAHRLIASGVGPETLVALCLPRSADLVVAVLAVLKAGGAYLPLDPAHPADRIRFILDDATPAVVITGDAALGRSVADGCELIDPAAADIAAQPTTSPGVPGDLSRLAYVIYTSGSTGRPKGVLVEHRGVANLFTAAGDFRFDHTDVWTLFHSIAFDFSVWELWGPLIHGGTLVVVPAEAAVSPEAFWDLARRHRVTVLNQTPAVFAQLTVACPGPLGQLDLRHIIFGGEKLEPGHLATWRQHGVPDTRLVNMYGITEITVHATCHPVSETGAGPIALGEPLAGTDLHLLSPVGAAVRPGETGEICIGGAGVARGYLNRPALTAARFVPHPQRPGQRLYRSGDLGRIEPDGRLCYLGRSDDQVKIRGHRVEPGEIESALCALPGIERAVVVPQSDAGQTRLVAYFVLGLEAGTTVDEDIPGASPAELRAGLRQLLPEYLVPSGFVRLPSIPLTANGKVDRSALPPVPPASPGPALPATPAEVTISGFITDMLQVDAVGRDDDLFALGWHSLLMARLALRAEEHFGVRVPLQTLFNEPTVRSIAAAVDQETPRRNRARGITRADRSSYTAARRSDGALTLPGALAGDSATRR